MITQITQIAPLEFAAWCQEAVALAPGIKPLLMDVREPWEVQTASLPDQALNGCQLLAIPMGDVPAQLADLQAGFTADQPIACLCHHGMRSQRVASFLAANGFTRVVNVKGGIDAWSRQVDARIPLY